MQVVLDARSYRLASSAKAGNGLITDLVPEAGERLGRKEVQKLVPAPFQRNLASEKVCTFF
jgi:hypothetical protein